MSNGLPGNLKIGKDFQPDDQEKIAAIAKVFESAQDFLSQVQSAENKKGYVIQKRETRPSPENPSAEEEFFTYLEFHPILLKQHENKPYLTFNTFNQVMQGRNLFKIGPIHDCILSQTVDQFFSQVEAQKIDMKVVNQEKQAMKKLENVKKDHEMRVEKLQTEQSLDRRRAELIEMNEQLVDSALMVNSDLFYSSIIDFQVGVVFLNRFCVRLWRIRSTGRKSMSWSKKRPRTVTL